MLMKSALLLTVTATLLTGAGDWEPGTGADAPILAGIASQYGPGRMEATIQVRQAGRTAFTLPTPLPQAEVYFATLDCRDIGSWFEMRRAGVDENGVPYPWETAYAVDCAGLADGGIGFMLFNRHTPMSQRVAEEWLRRVHTGEYQPVFVAEVDYPTAVRWNTVGRGMRVELRRLTPSPLDLPVAP
ncbi:MAG TPA: hypothetical protein P5195_06430 [Anaerolineae bacterium]|nr:hypothetical protein [Anaerolineae bacterium]HRT32364.1 hypothetical protein [Anaerolineae bacterium]HRU94845.1 hypothetical protein [Anaerolineae bacterium]HXK43080.1 hypothetical protein [Anaerolineae bacterium]